MFPEHSFDRWPLPVEVRESPEPLDPWDGPDGTVRHVVEFEERGWGHRKYAEPVKVEFYESTGDPIADHVLGSDGIRDLEKEARLRKLEGMLAGKTGEPLLIYEPGGAIVPTLGVCELVGDRLVYPTGTPVGTLDGEHVMTLAHVWPHVCMPTRLKAWMNIGSWLRPLDLQAGHPYPPERLVPNDLKYPVTVSDSGVTFHSRQQMAIGSEAIGKWLAEQDDGLRMQPYTRMYNIVAEKIGMPVLALEKAGRIQRFRARKTDKQLGLR